MRDRQQGQARQHGERGDAREPVVLQVHVRERREVQEHVTRKAASDAAAVQAHVRQAGGEVLLPEEEEEEERDREMS